MGRLNVLVVDRDGDAREALRDVLEVEGFQAMAAPCSKEGQYLLRQCETPCVILIRMMGSPRTGLDFVRLAEHEMFLLRIAEEILRETCPAKEALEPEVEAISVQELIERRRAHQQAVARTLRPIVRTRPQAILLQRAAGL